MAHQVDVQAARRQPEGYTMFGVISKDSNSIVHSCHCINNMLKHIKHLKHFKHAKQLIHLKHFVYRLAHLKHVSHLNH